MASNFSINGVQIGSQAFHSIKHPDKTGRTNFNSTTAIASRKRRYNQFQQGLQESTGVSSSPLTSTTPDFVTSQDTDKGWAIRNLPSKKLAEGLKRAFKKGIVSPHFEVIVETLGEGKFGLLVPWSENYDYRQFLGSFKQRIEFLVSEFFKKAQLTIESEDN